MSSRQTTETNLLALNIAGVVAECVIYGIFLVLFCGGMYLRISRFDSQRGDLWWNPVVICTVAIFLICTAHWSLTLTRFLRAFTGSHGSALAYYCRPNDLLQSVNAAITIVSLWFGDALIIHRLWVIWERNAKVTAIPTLCWLGLVGSGISAIVAISKHLHYNNGVTSAFLPVNWLLRIITNVYCTAFIAWRLWRVREIETGPTSQLGILTTLLAVSVESAAILTAWSVFYAVTNETESPLNLIASNLTSQIIGLTNMLIQIRIGLGWSRTTTTHESDMVMTSNGSMFRVNVHVAESVVDIDRERGDSDSEPADKNLAPRLVSSPRHSLSS
ncbi:hypothetical protein C8F01DRAFT_770294 [Mycena amicta]|nr:hypothetical protein C8F01DRAFT_770294 [Mycena amicta]